LLEKRYGKSVKKRIFALGERFREIDEFLETAARRWMKCNLKEEVDGRSGTWREKSIVGGRLRFQRKPFGKHPSALRKKILQNVCFERVGIAPNERLLESMDRLIASGGASARLNVGKGAVLKCRYEQAIVDMSGMNARTTGENGKDRDVRAGKSAFKGKRLSLEMNGPGRYGIDDVGQEGAVPQAGVPVEIRWEEKGRVQQSGLKRLAKGERAAAFHRGEILLPLYVRPLRAGDRIRPFGLPAEKKVKEILIDRKVPREERWGRPIVCDAKGTILWIPGVIRSAHAPVTANTRRIIVLRLEFQDITGNNRIMTK
jgi:tRNA(Ile)-lysidine synthetase-like protein